MPTALGAPLGTATRTGTGASISANCSPYCQILPRIWRTGCQPAPRTMPKSSRRDKQKSRETAGNDTRHAAARTRSVQDLLTTRLPLLQEVARQGAAASTCSVTVKSSLAANLAVHVQQVRLLHGRLTVMTESAAWAARLRYALAEAEPQLRAAHPEIDSVAVKVSPTRTPPGLST